MMAEVANLVIDRSKWARGAHKDTCLLDSADDMKCCLGFYGLALGNNRSSLVNEADPECTSDSTHWPSWLLDADEEESLYHRENSAECKALINFNDDESIPDSERESHIAGIFAKHGVEVEFIDSAVSA